MTWQGLRALELGDRPGAGPRTAHAHPLVIIPGIDDSVHDYRWLPRIWRWFFAPLARGRRVVLLGRRRGLPDGTSIGSLADEYADVLARQLGPADVLGISMGGMIAQALAARRPALVRRLALVVTAHTLAPAGHDSGDHLGALADAGRWRAFLRHANHLCFDGRTTRVARPLMWLLGSPLLGRRAPAARDFAISARACAQHDAAAWLHHIVAPTLVWSAADDQLFPTPTTQALAAALPHAWHVSAPGAHAAFMQRRSDFQAAIAGFLEAQVPRARAPRPRDAQEAA